MHGNVKKISFNLSLVSSLMWEVRGFFEKFYPYLVGILVGVLHWCFWGNMPAPSTSPSILGAVVSVSGIAVGFLAAAQSIILTMSNSRIVKSLKKGEYYNRLIRYLEEAIYSGSRSDLLVESTCCTWYPRGFREQFDNQGRQ